MFLGTKTWGRHGFDWSQWSMAACRTEQLRYTAHIAINANNTNYRPALAVA